eukprot:Blabericola_migrator_1__2705@NODE_176_length_11972_cov_72_986308_g153_i0_p4_GENE_NODE_176_length_11972_cov_72_986308_g153_i0NODE_176_length_11972_cov_72_986308_g153_i0_p4_ORF_typecomplete_len120_score7_53_NODE_176_length_11972_cov_72_986308_g153_i068257184
MSRLARSQLCHCVYGWSLELPQVELEMRRISGADDAAADYITRVRILTDEEVHIHLPTSLVSLGAVELQTIRATPVVLKESFKKSYKLTDRRWSKVTSNATVMRCHASYMYLRHSEQQF